MRIANDIKPTGRAGKSNAFINDPGIRYNEPGVTYNQAGIAYGGLYGETDSQPIPSRVVIPAPRIVFAGDFQGTVVGPRVLGAGMLIGILGLTYPVSGTIQP